MHLLGVIEHQDGNHQAALTLINHAIMNQPSVAVFRVNLGTVLGMLGRLDEAVMSYRQALALDPMSFDALFHLAETQHRLGRTAEAVDAAARAARLRPHDSAIHSLLAAVWLELDQKEKALDSYQALLRLEPDNAAAHLEAGSILFNLRRYAEAAASCRMALSIRPELWEARLRLAAALNALNEPEQALDQLALAETFSRDQPVFHSLRGAALLEIGQLGPAIASLRRSLRLDPEFSPAHFNLGLALLLKGDFRNGWKEYEWRGASQQFAARRGNPPQPVWNGRPLDGRRIVVHAEQGLGDAIQFARFLPSVASMGGMIRLECLPPLQRLFQRLACVEAVVTVDEPLPDFDVRVPLLSLPRLLHVTLDNIPASGPYLDVGQEVLRHWRKRIAHEDTRLRVGLAWRGSPTNVHDARRSTSLAALAPLLDMPGVQFFSLQKRSPDEGPLDGAVVDLDPLLTDFLETAAAIECLDLVVTVDTAVAHLAGALAKPVWLLLSFVPDWRWLLDRNDSPWYPTARLFRQKSAGDWHGLVHDVREALEGVVSHPATPGRP